MTEAFWQSVAPICAAGLAASLLVERLLAQPPALVARPWRAHAVHVGVWTVAFALVLALCQRPVFAALLVLAEQLLLVQVSNAKVRALREPFVFADVEYLTDALKHPRLFLPYLGAGRALAAAGAFGTALLAGFALEPSLLDRAQAMDVAGGIALLFALGAGLIRIGTPRTLPVSFDAGADLLSLGQIAAAWYYLVAERRPFVAPRTFRHLPAAQATAQDARPHLVVVQSESFFDARRLHAAVRPDVLAEFDRIRAQSVAHGRLVVPAWGGNTARTEFAFLSGLAAQQLGVHRYNPYRKLPLDSVDTVARRVGALGYETVCVHPYPATFYSRDRAYPQMGFDCFIDIAAFREAGRYGPYVSDAAVTDQVCALLDAAQRPTFVFVITMENHGPLHLERVGADDETRLYSAPPPPGYDDLTVYLRHLANADRMMRRLGGHLDRLGADSLLCWYGDHVPILPSVYDQSGFPDGMTEYFIWQARRAPGIPAVADLRVEALGSTLLRHAGLMVDANVDGRSQNGNAGASR